MTVIFNKKECTTTLICDECGKQSTYYMTRILLVISLATTEGWKNCWSGMGWSHFCSDCSVFKVRKVNNRRRWK